MSLSRAWRGCLLALCFATAAAADEPQPEGLTVSWADNYLTIRGPDLPGGEMKVLYLEAYCRPGSTDRDWRETVIGHRTKLIAADPDGKRLELECALNDGVVVRHKIRAGRDEVDFRLTATNPTQRASAAHWAQPCIRVGDFTGLDKKRYISRCFIFLDGRLTRMPTPHWATEARYVPGQVWRPTDVDPDDVNPRPLSDLIPSNGLIGCFSADETMLMATAFEPYQELFQGVAHCIHSDFRLGGLEPGETKKVRGKIYIVRADVERLLERYARDFPEHQRKHEERSN